MSKRTTLMAAAVGVGILTLATVQAQQKSGATLSAMDYIQINQLINRYAFAVDTGADQGGMYAGLFAPGGRFLQRGGVSHTGREALANVGYRNSRGPQSVFHFLMSHAIESTPDGNARGKEQLVQWELGNAGQPSKIFGGGHYDDIYERTKDGWRFKQRQFIPSQSRLRAGHSHDTRARVPEGLEGAGRCQDDDRVGLRRDSAAARALSLRVGYRPAQGADVGGPVHAGCHVQHVPGGRGAHEDRLAASPGTGTVLRSQLPPERHHHSHARGGGRAVHDLRHRRRRGRQAQRPPQRRHLP